MSCAKQLRSDTSFHLKLISCPGSAFSAQQADITGASVTVLCLGLRHYFPCIEDAVSYLDHQLWH